MMTCINVAEFVLIIQRTCIVCILVNRDRHTDVCRLFKQLRILMYIDVAELYSE